MQDLKIKIVEHTLTVDKDGLRLEPVKKPKPEVDLMPLLLFCMLCITLISMSR